MERIAAVSVNDFNACSTEVSLLLRSEFLRLGIQREGALVPGFVRVAGKATVILHNLVGHIRILDRRSVIKMKEIIQIANLHLIRRMSCV